MTPEKKENPKRNRAQGIECDLTDSCACYVCWIELELSTQREKLEACREEHRCVVDNLCAALMPDSPIENARGEFSLDAMGACQIIGRMRDELSTLETYCTDLGKTISGMGEELSTCRAALEQCPFSFGDLACIAGRGHSGRHHDRPDVSTIAWTTEESTAKELVALRAEAKRYREAIENAECADDCESNKDKCAVCGGEFDEHPVPSDCGKPCEEFELNACDCWKSKALADPPAKPVVPPSRSNTVPGPLTPPIPPRDRNVEDPFPVIHCECGNEWTQEVNTVCPVCFRWPAKAPCKTCGDVRKVWIKDNNTMSDNWRPCPDCQPAKERV